MANTPKKKVYFRVIGIVFLVEALLFSCTFPLSTNTALPTTFTPIFTPNIHETLVAVSTNAVFPDDRHPLEWLQGVPCRAPCWEGITPGLTTVSQATTLLKNNSLISSVKVFMDNGFGNGEIEFHWKDGDHYMLLGFKNNEPDPVIDVIMPDFYGHPFSFNDVIQTYGYPSHLGVEIPCSRDQKGILTCNYFIELLYLDQGMRVESLYRQKPSIIDGQMEIYSVEFFIPGKEGWARAWQGDFDRFYIVWQGFKKFEYYCIQLKGENSTNCK